jgi:hypothetical protein
LLQNTESPGRCATFLTGIAFFRPFFIRTITDRSHVPMEIGACGGKNESVEGASHAKHCYDHLIQLRDLPPITVLFTKANLMPLEFLSPSLVGSPRSLIWVGSVLGVGALLAGVSASPAAAGTLQFQVTDERSEPLPCRIHLKDEAGQPVRPSGFPFWRDHFVCAGTAVCDLPDGSYTFQIERGPEHRRYSGSARLTGSGTVKFNVQLPRIAHLAQQGWYAGDLHIHRPVADVPLLLQAEDLHIAPVITWWNARNLWAGEELPAKLLEQLPENRYYHLMAGEDERAGGALMYFNLAQPLAITAAGKEHPSPMTFVADARRQAGVHIDIEKPFWWDVPVWLASGEIDTIGLANNHMCRSSMYETEAWGHPRDAERLPAPRGNGFWTQEIYYHVLNTAVRVPPSAGSASGVLPNPVGSNRVYVHTGDDFNYDAWWASLKAGRSFVTNGPLLITRADDHLPGHLFRAKQGETLSIPLNVVLTTNDTVPAIEIIKNGRVEQSVPIERLKQTDDHTRSGLLGPIEFSESGWFLIRAIADDPRTFRFASSAPYYVEVGPDKQRISRESARFFVDWVDERIKRVEADLKSPHKLQEVLVYHQRAREFWQQKLDNANAE